MINVFETSFEARERRFQIEKLYHGETVDLVGTITTDGVLKNITGYTVQGVFQPTTAQGSDQFYELSADIVDNKVVVHWEKGKDFGEPSYMVWALLTDGDDASYPITWRLDMAYSPNFPLSALDPIPKAIDFSKYELLNAPWLELSAAGDLPYIPLSVENSLPYVALSGGTVNSGFSLKSNGNTILGGLNDSPTIGIFSTATGFSTAVGYNAKATARYSTAVGSVTKTTGENATAVGYGAKALSAKSTAVGGDSTAGGVGSIAVGYGAVTGGQNAVAVGFGSRANADNSMQIGYGTNNVSNSLKVLGKMVLSGDNLTLDPERVPYLSDYAEKEELTAYAQLSDIPVLPDDLVHEDELSDYAQLSDIPELPEDLVHEDELSVYAQLSDLENIDIDGMSACLSSAEFSEIEELPNDGSASLSSIIAKIDEVIRALKRANQPEPPSPLPSADYYVATYGSDTNDGSQSAPFATIQRAINACSGNGEKILVRDGTYSPITATNLDISIVSENGPDTTIIDGLSASSCVRGSGNVSELNLKIIGFTIQNGVVGSTADDGAGVSRAIIDRCIVKDCSKQGYGSGGGITQGQAYNTLFINCYAASNGGGANGSRIYNCTFINCTTANRNDATTACWAYNCLTNGQSFASNNEIHNCSTDGAACFVDAAGGNYRLKAGSSAVNAGSASYLNADYMTDLDGNPRLVGDAPDQGCYEFQG